MNEFLLTAFIGCLLAGLAVSAFAFLKPIFFDEKKPGGIYVDRSKGSVASAIVIWGLFIAFALCVIVLFVFDLGLMGALFL